MKNKDTSKADYLKVSVSHLQGKQLVLKDGDYLSIETKAFQKKNLEEGREAGRVNAETYEKWSTNIEKIPDFVRADVFLTIKTDN